MSVKIRRKSGKFGAMGKTRNISDTRALVNVKVHPALREYILSVNAGSDIIVPMRDSRLWGLVKMYLEPIPSDYRPVLPEGEPDSIRIALFRTGKPVYVSENAGDTLYGVVSRKCIELALKVAYNTQKEAQPDTSQEVRSERGFEA